LYKIIYLKRLLPVILLILCSAAKAQHIDSIYVHLYTDSLKKGTYNYINVDGLMSNGHYLPLDSAQLRFSASSGKFFGNSLWIDKETKEEKIIIRAQLKTNPATVKEFTMYIKKRGDDEPLKTVDELMRETPAKHSRDKKG
jgi:hypothetical protein